MGTRDGGRGKVSSGLALAGAAALGAWLGRGGPESAALAGPPANVGAPAAQPASDYGQRVVAYIYGTTPVTREDLGEYLIARGGADKVELLVNKRIIEMACQKRGIDVTDAEVNATIENDCATMNVKRNEFISHVLKQRGMTLYEYKEDVVKPGLLLTKLCKDRVQVTDDDLRKAFEAQYGAKVEVRILIWPKGEEKHALNAYDKIRKSEEEFDRAARTQANPHLAAVGGGIKPITRFSGTHPELEKEVFALQPGEVTRLIVTPEGTVCAKCDQHLPGDTKIKFDDHKDNLRKLVFDKKVQAEMPLVFKGLRDEAKPVFYLKKAQTAEDLKAEVQQEIQQTGAGAPPKK